MTIILVLVGVCLLAYACRDREKTIRVNNWQPSRYRKGGADREAETRL